MSNVIKLSDFRESQQEDILNAALISFALKYAALMEEMAELGERFAVVVSEYMEIK